MTKNEDLDFYGPFAGVYFAISKNDKPNYFGICKISETGEVTHIGYCKL